MAFMGSIQPQKAFRRLFAHWYLLCLAARCLQLILIFHAVAPSVSAAWMGAVMAVSATVCAVLTVFAGRLFNRLGPAPLNRCAALCCGAAALLATRNEILPALAAAWMLTAMTLMLASTAGYRGIGSLFDATERVSSFSRMSLMSNINEILIPIVISAAFARMPWLPPCVIFGVCLLIPFLPAGITRAEFQAQGQVESRALMVNLRRFFCSGALLAGVTAGAGIHALLCVYDVLIPTASAGLGLTTTQIGMLLSASALSQVAASWLLSMRPNHRTLLGQLRNALLLGGVALSGAVFADGFFSFLAVVAVSGFGFGLIQPLSMSTIFLFAPADSVGDIVGLRLMLNNLSRILMSLLMAAAVGGFMTSPAFLTMAAMIVLVLTLGTTVWQMVRRKMPA